MEIKSAVIDSVQFGLLSKERIEKLSYYELEPHVAAKRHNVFNDSRLGTTRRDILCGTCNCDYTTHH
jgi:DNA-directed RNA polymerase beta' subunit